LGEVLEVAPPEQVLAEQPIGVLVATALPWTEGPHVRDARASFRRLPAQLEDPDTPMSGFRRR
jgi:hypothetical protein